MPGVVPLPALDERACMREALDLAAAAAEAGELPIGAVVVIDGEVVGRGRARQHERRTQLAHAEVEALLDAGEAVFTRHDEAVLLSTVEPCPMCLGAAVMADVPHVLFAVRDPNAGVPATVVREPYVRRHIATYRGGLLEDEARALIVAHNPGFAAVLGLAPS